MDASEIGKFGTLRLMKRLEPHKVVAAFPIDDDEVTIGRDQDCSIRLYYDSVSALHCKIIFRERKVAYLSHFSSPLRVDLTNILGPNRHFWSYWAQTASSSTAALFFPLQAPAGSPSRSHSPTTRR